MKPTNHLRWKVHTHKVALNPGVYGDMRTREQDYQVLEQFWEDDNLFDTLKQVPPNWNEQLQKFGEWREIEVVK